MIVNNLSDGTLDRAEQIRRDAETAYARYRNDGRLTAAAIRAGIASAWLDAKTKMGLLEATTTDQAANNRDRAMKTAFGSPGTDAASVIAARDASDRAAQLEPDDWRRALSLMDQAALNSDESLARAVALRAFDLGYSGDGTWGQVLDRFTASRPGAAQAMADLENSTVSLASNSAFALLSTFVLPKPPEIGNVDDWAVPGIAQAG